MFRLFLSRPRGQSVFTTKTSKCLKGESSLNRKIFKIPINDVRVILLQQTKRYIGRYGVMFMNFHYPIKLSGFQTKTIKKLKLT